MGSSLLDPQDRRLLFDAFRPPEGYSLSFGIGTTYSLDLNTLLAAPLAFTFFDWEDGEEPTTDPLPLLEALRRYSDRLSVFCQAGQIKVPSRQQPLYGYLEKSVIEVRARHQNGVFHPKVWVFRFESSQGPARYRLLCSSRNLTFDRSWDCVLALDGERVERERAFAANHPLADFVAALPGLSVRPVPSDLSESIAALSEELRRVKWELPGDFESFRFWPMGLEERETWPFDKGYTRFLAVSPFVDEKAIQRLSNLADRSMLVGRLEELASLNPAFLRKYTDVFCMNPAIEVEQDAAEEAEEAVGLRGLHAKLYIAEAGWDAHVWLGSANATNAAFRRNVEFLVELVGKKSRCGVDAFWEGDAPGGGFQALVCRFEPGKAADAVDEEKRKLEEKLEEWARSVASLAFRATVKQEDNAFRFVLEAEHPAELKSPPGSRIQFWPVTLSDSHAKPIGPGTPAADFGVVAFESLTSFFACELSLSTPTASARLRFVLNVPLLGAPEDRRERILRSILGNRQQVLRFLLFLLAESGAEEAGDLLMSPGTLTGAGEAGSAEHEWPLFESLMRTLDRNPKKLDQVARLIEDLKRTPEGAGLLPPGFDAIWQPIWSARESLKT